MVVKVLFREFIDHGASACHAGPARTAPLSWRGQGAVSRSRAVDGCGEVGSVRVATRTPTLAWLRWPCYRMGPAWGSRLAIMCVTTTKSEAAAAVRIGAGLGRKRDELLGLLRPCFARPEPWLQAGKYVSA